VTLLGRGLGQLRVLPRRTGGLMLVRFAPDCRYEPPPEFYGSGMLIFARSSETSAASISRSAASPSAMPPIVAVRLRDCVEGVDRALCVQVLE